MGMWPRGRGAAVLLVGLLAAVVATKVEAEYVPFDEH
jgi:hypothetical protein